MISKHDLIDYGFKNTNDYFTYILNSKINGQNTQCVNLIKEMSKPQRKDFLDYLEFLEFSPNDDESIFFLKYKTIELI
jgi:hypothetical protein